MGKPGKPVPGPPAPGMLICGAIARSTELIKRAGERLAVSLGPVDHESDTIPFDFTDYYRAEMGAGLLRRWLAFKRPVDPDELKRIKLATNDIETELADDAGRRRVNLDPGILTDHNLVLASTKDFAHRVYLGDGIFAEPTLVYESGRFRPLDWTYPDYRTETCNGFLARCRELLVKKRTGRLTDRATGS